MGTFVALAVFVPRTSCFVPAAHAGAPSGTDLLHRFFRDVNSVSARFNQVVLDEALNTIQESSGTLWIERPNKFRWDYDTPYKQQIVADGKNIWVYDKELQQVTVRQLRGGLGDTPAVLLAGRGQLDDKFTVKSLGEQGKLVWAQLIPKTKDGGYENIRIGFEGGKLRTLEMADGFGQTTRVTLHDSKENPKLAASTFEFTPPKGVDVVGE
jgi:outer membrane lipoprotein carrier protein